MKNVLDFLKDLRANNDREWMQTNKPRYDQVKKEFLSFIEDVIKGISAFDDSIVGLTPKECVFRLNRDVRFSKDKSPYKTHFGAAIMEGGRKSPNPTYYIHVEAERSFLAGGLYLPAPENLKKIRQEIDYNSEELKRIVEDSAFRKKFDTMTGESLKTTPRGYPKDHPNIELLRFKSFLVTKDLSNSEVVRKDLLDNVLDDFKAIQPFNNYFSVAIS